MSAEGKAGLYKVTGVIERMDIDEKGRFKRMVEISAVTTSGIEYTVMMSKADFAKKLADEQLTKEAQELEAVRKLSR
jgi:hypothetical protein